MRKSQKRGPHFAGACCIILCVMLGTVFSPQLEKLGESAALLSAGITLPQGGTALALAEIRGDDIIGNTTSSQAVSQPSSVTPSSATSSASSTSSISSKTAETSKGKGKILEEKFKRTGSSYENVYVRNANPNNYTLNIKETLSKRPDFKYKKGKVQVLVFHTHTTEAFESKDLGYYIEGKSMRTTDKKKSIVAVGAKIVEQLKKAGIGVVHDSTYHDYPSYSGAYGRSETTIKKIMKQYPDITVLIDVHRDAITRSGGVRVKPTAVIGEKKVAQVMLITGTDNNGKLKFPDWEYNLRFALRWQKQMETNAPYLTRPVYFAPRRYNMHMTHNSLLLEVGSEANTLDEALYAGELAGKALADTLLSLK